MKNSTVTRALFVLAYFVLSIPASLGLPLADAADMNGAVGPNVNKAGTWTSDSFSTAEDADWYTVTVTDL